jgi:hypothetical protein
MGEPVATRKRILSAEDQHIPESNSSKRLRHLIEESGSPQTVSLSVPWLVHVVRTCSTNDEALDAANALIAPIQSKLQRQTEATRLLFKALTNSQSKAKEEIATWQDRAIRAEHALELMQYQRAQENRVYHPGWGGHGDDQVF